MIKGQYIPWWMKIAIKIVLYRLRLPYHIWRKLNVFKHGSMLDKNYALSVYDECFKDIQRKYPDGFNLLELGPGDSISTGIIASTRGSRQTILVDSGNFASKKVDSYITLLEKLDLDIPESFIDILEGTNTIYLTEGINSLKDIDSSSIDVVVSNAVLEHIYLEEFEETLHELYRIQKHGGMSYHRIDYKDHLSQSLNSLRFSKNIWEKPWFAKSGFYTNRLRAVDVVMHFERQGYKVESIKYNRWKELPLNKSLLHKEFQNYSDDDLLINGMDLKVIKER